MVDGRGSRSLWVVANLDSSPGVTDKKASRVEQASIQHFSVISASVPASSLLPWASTLTSLSDGLRCQSIRQIFPSLSHAGYSQHFVTETKSWLGQKDDTTRNSPCCHWTSSPAPNSERREPSPVSCLITYHTDTHLGICHPPPPTPAQ